MSAGFTVECMSSVGAGIPADGGERGARNREAFVHRREKVARDTGDADT